MMATLGAAFYPRITVSEAAQIATQIDNEFRGTISTSGLASHLGMSAGGGGFHHKLTALLRYGLLAGRGTLSVTPLGQRIAHPRDPAERDEALGQAFLNVDLFRRLHDRLRESSPNESQFRILLEEETGAERRAVAAVLPRIRRLYEDGARLLRRGGGTDADTDDGETAAVGATHSPDMSEREVGPVSRITLSSGDYRIPVERTKRGIQLLRKHLDLLEEQLEMESNGVGGVDLG